MLETVKGDIGLELLLSEYSETTSRIYLPEDIRGCTMLGDWLVTSYSS